MRAVAIKDPLWLDEFLGRRSGGWTAGVARTVLRVAACGYQAAIACRNLYYSHVPQAVQRVSVPVISVGNLTVGGTGKTPVTMMVAELLATKSRHVAIVSRGYGRVDHSANDEAQEIATRLPQVPHVIGGDRLKAAKAAIDRFHADVVVLDDGFQHRRLYRDLDLVLLDAMCPFGYGYLLPRGLLREPISALRRADVVMLTRADLVEETERQRIWSVVDRWQPHALRVEISFRPRCLQAGGQSEPLHTYRRVAAFCGVGNPKAFLRTLQSCGYEVPFFRTFPDHCAYTEKRLKELSHWVASLPNIQAVFCTGKDWVKIRQTQLGQRPLRALQIEPVVISGARELCSCFERVLT